MVRNTNGTGFSLKDELFNEAKVRWLGEQFYHADANFDTTGFVQAVMAQLLDLELKARIEHIATCLEHYLDQDFTVMAEQIEAALPTELDPTKTDDDFGDFIIAPLGVLVVRHGCTKRHLKRSLQLLHAVTRRFSMEDAIRFFINAYPDETFATLTTWAKDPHYHVRRLVSEGTRPRLPWSGRLKTDITRPLPLLDILQADPTRYVTRSVANHLNDISKSDPELVITTLKTWQKTSPQTKAELDWLTKHALRSLIKQGNTAALQLLGYKPTPHISVSLPTLQQAVVAVGEMLEFSFTITADTNERLLVDYVIGFVKANGEIKPKVHKLKTLEVTAGATTTLTKKHPFRKGATTISYYSGEHTLALQINGQIHSAVSFTLTT